MADIKKYWASSSMKFNCESMRTKLLNIRDYMRDGEDDKGNKFPDSVEICGKEVDLDSIDDLIEEVENLVWAAMTRKLTGKEYGRMKAIAEERQMMRYATCLASGMSERDAGYAFTD